MLRVAVIGSGPAAALVTGTAIAVARSVAASAMAPRAAARIEVDDFILPPIETVGARRNR